jgi:3-oxoacyl-[acyl-carrier protein] reductase
VDRLRGKLAVVTGGGSGLGEAICRRFAEEGAQLVVNDLSLEAAERVAEEVDGWAVAFDVSDSGAVDRGFAEVAERYQRLDVLVNNAGIAPRYSDEERAARDALLLQHLAEVQSGGEIETFLDTTVDLADDDWREMLAVHLDGTFFCTRAALRTMGPQRSGAIVNMGSIMGTSGGSGAPAYCAAKAGILGFTRAVALEVVRRGIRVNAIAPGFIDTPMTAPIGAARPLLLAQTPMARFGEPDDIAWAAVYLASDEAKFVTGQVLSPNGGWHMSQ